MSARSREALGRLASAGFGSIALRPGALMRDPETPEILFVRRGARGETDEGLVRAVGDAHAAGMTAMLDPAAPRRRRRARAAASRCRGSPRGGSGSSRTAASSCTKPSWPRRPAPTSSASESADLDRRAEERVEARDRRGASRDGRAAPLRAARRAPARPTSRSGTVSTRSASSSSSRSRAPRRSRTPRSTRAPGRPRGRSPSSRSGTRASRSSSPQAGYPPVRARLDDAGAMAAVAPPLPRTPPRDRARSSGPSGVGRTWWRRRLLARRRTRLQLLGTGGEGDPRRIPARGEAAPVSTLLDAAVDAAVEGGRVLLGQLAQSPARLGRGEAEERLRHARRPRERGADHRRAAGPLPRTTPSSRRRAARAEGPAPGAREWIIDPLDGTSNFVSGFPFWCVSIAAREGEELVAARGLGPAARRDVHGRARRRRVAQRHAPRGHGTRRTSTGPSSRPGFRFATGTRSTPTSPSSRPSSSTRARSGARAPRPSTSPTSRRASSTASSSSASRPGTSRPARS